MSDTDPSALPYLVGLDVSHHQDPDRFAWPQLSESVDFVIARATYGTSRDRAVERFVERCRQHEIAVGLYLFFRPSEPATAQAEVFRETARKVGYGIGDICPWLDVEDDPYPTMQPVTASWALGVERVGSYLEQDWGQVGIYANAVDMADLGPEGRASWTNRPHWVASWTKRQHPTHIWGGNNWAIWQHAVEPHQHYLTGQAIDQNRAVDLPRITSTPSLTPPSKAPVVYTPQAPAEWWDASRRAKQRQQATAEWIRRNEAE
jgi:GH25 family lysozyme M1 (1,4-beta-N-acetylmuramidase)